MNARPDRRASQRMRVRRWIVATCATLALAHTQAQAVEATVVPVIKQTTAGRYLDAREAYALKQKMGTKAFFVDVRTRYEVAYLGMPTVADANIAYVEHPDDAPWDDKAGRFKLEVNSDFGPELARRMAAKGLGKGDVVIVMCRSGDRSARAANLLSQLGYASVFSVVDGFEGDVATSGPRQGQRVVNGWKNADLPWSYKLDKERMTMTRLSSE
ncbi:rhodanese-like domain-containing protein [Massilia sp. TWR1-2-2]|uniref:rhodanese-like domain-containing protein n=1 Tax=Massilia sp. TWR1-2-2 TaxID=2804584 RepID=UPI003CF15085